MQPTFRRAFNADFSEQRYEAYLRDLEASVGTGIHFRVAETPLFLPRQLRERLERHAREVAKLATEPSLVARMSKGIPPRFFVPGMDAMPSCIQVDFAIVEEPDGTLGGRVVELQAFPSLYGLMVFQLEATRRMLQAIPGLDRPWTMYFGGLDRDAFVARLRDALLDGERPEHVVLVDLDPPKQKTFPDFEATRLLFGIDSVCLTALKKDGRSLYREVGGERVPVRRIFNRVVFDEIEKKGAPMAFSWNDELDVSWCSHPNWYWPISKLTLPYLDHPSVPRARYLSELERVPDDLERYVLKPLFSFAGAGVIVDVTKADLDKVPEAERPGWILQEKITYAPALTMPEGQGVKAEIRMMFLREPARPEPELVMNLVRLSRGKMLGVDWNKDLTWVGGSLGIWPADQRPDEP